MVAKLKTQKFVVDGELVIPIGGALSFDELHCASIRGKSSAEIGRSHPALFVVFDLLVDERGKNLVPEPLRVRRRALEKFARANFKTKGLRLTGHDRSEGCEKWFDKVGGNLDGVMRTADVIQR